MKFSLFTAFILLSANAFSQSAYYGKLIDKHSGTCLPFAHVIIVCSNTETVSNYKGVFYFSDNIQNIDSVTVYAEGYHCGKFPLIKGRENILNLEPLNGQLDEVMIKASTISAHDIIRKVKQNFTSNYESGFFRQRFYLNQSCFNYDSMYANTEEIIDKYEVRDQKIRDLNAKEERVNRYDTSFCEILSRD